MQAQSHSGTATGSQWIYRLIAGFCRWFYRVGCHGASQVPVTGPVLLVGNHVSYIDGLFVLSMVGRPVRFIVYADLYDRWYLKPFLQRLGAIRISAAGGPRMILHALRDAGQYLDEGDAVCIFAEGQLTRTGQFNALERGFQRIIKRRNAPIVPFYLHGLHESWFSPARSVEPKRWYRHLRLPGVARRQVLVVFGASLPSDADVPTVYQAIARLSAEAMARDERLDQTVDRQLIAHARRHAGMPAVSDTVSNGRVLSWRKTLAGAIALAHHLRVDLHNRHTVGVCLPPSMAGAIVNYAMALAGRCTVNLNFTTGNLAMGQAIEQAGLDLVLTSRRFAEKLELQLPDHVAVLYVDDLFKLISRWDRLKALGLAMWGGADQMGRYCGRPADLSADSRLTIIFSSGSTGTPKGIVLSHRNMTANVLGAQQVLGMVRGDRFVGILPAFHAFGYMALWFTAHAGIFSYFHPNPLDAEVVGHLVARHRLTLLIATPTFVRMYLRRVLPWQFGSLRLALTGAEALPADVAEAFESRFGLKLIQGYGMTECAPIVATNGLDVRNAGVYQAGQRAGTVGRPLPGVAVRMVDPADGRAVPVGQEGVVQVKGPSLMSGYLDAPELTAEVMVDGWYHSGDMGRLDAEGFLTITGRLSRFAKIGGEMVSHEMVQQALHRAAGVTGQLVFAVTSLPDPKHGERLVVLHTVARHRIGKLLDRLRAMGLSGVCIPRANRFVRMDHLPLLGSGKLDLKAVRRAAEQAMAGSTESQGQ